MSDDRPDSPSLLNRLLQNPAVLRRRSRVVAVVVATLAAVAGGGWLESGVLSSGLTALVWLFVPVVAVGIGMGDAFFLRYGVGERRVALTALLGLVTAVTGCAVLAVINTPGSGGSWLAGTLYFLLVVGTIALLASGIAIAAGRGSGYLSRRIKDVDDTGW